MYPLQTQLSRFEFASIRKLMLELVGLGVFPPLEEEKSTFCPQMSLCYVSGIGGL